MAVLDAVGLAFAGALATGFLAGGFSVPTAVFAGVFFTGAFAFAGALAWLLLGAALLVTPFVAVDRLRVTFCFDGDASVSTDDFETLPAAGFAAVRTRFTAGFLTAGFAFGSWAVSADAAFRVRVVLASAAVGCAGASFVSVLRDRVARAGFLASVPVAPVSSV